MSGEAQVLPESYVTDEFPWVIVAEWVGRPPTVHGGFRSAEAADEAARRAWRPSDRPTLCAAWHVLRVSDPPVPTSR